MVARMISMLRDALVRSEYAQNGRFSPITLRNQEVYLFQTCSILNEGTKLYGQINDGIYVYDHNLIWIISGVVTRVESKLRYRLFKSGLLETPLYSVTRKGRQFSIGLDGRYECFDTGRVYFLADGFIIREVKYA